MAGRPLGASLETVICHRMCVLVTFVYYSKRGARGLSRWEFLREGRPGASFGPAFVWDGGSHQQETRPHSGDYLHLRLGLDRRHA